MGNVLLNLTNVLKESYKSEIFKLNVMIVNVFHVSNSLYITRTQIKFMKLLNVKHIIISGSRSGSNCSIEIYKLKNSYHHL